MRPAAIPGLTATRGATLVQGVGLSRRPNKGEPIIVSYVLTTLALVVVGLSKSGALWVALAATGLARTILTGLSTVVVHATSSDEMRARSLAIWAAASAGVVPLGGLITAGLASWLGVGGAILTDGLALGASGLLILARRPEVRWVGCTTLPVACIASTDPAAVAEQTVLSGKLVTAAPVRA